MWNEAVVDIFDLQVSERVSVDFGEDDECGRFYISAIFIFYNKFTIFLMDNFVKYVFLYVVKFTFIC